MGKEIIDVKVHITANVVFASYTVNYNNVVFHSCVQIKNIFFSKILDFLSFEGIVECFICTGFGCISLSNFQWYAWGVLKINIFQGI